MLTSGNTLALSGLEGMGAAAAPIVIPLLIVVIVAAIYIVTILAALLAGVVYGPVFLAIVRKKRHLFWFMPAASILGFYAILYIWGDGVMRFIAMPESAWYVWGLEALLHVVAIVLLLAGGLLNASAIAATVWWFQRKRERRKPTSDSSPTPQ